MPKIMLALDVSEWTPATEKLVKRLLMDGTINYVKLGLEVITAGFAERRPIIYKILKFLRELGVPVMIDAKIPDTPATMTRAVHNLAIPGVDFITIMANSGPASRKAALAAAESAGCMIVPATVLTSMDDADCRSVYGKNAIPKVKQFVREAIEEGFQAVVCAATDVPHLRNEGLLKSGLLTFTPGIVRTLGKRRAQKRVATPVQATQMGVDVVILGSAILKAPDPLKAADEIRQEMYDALKS